jgi:cytidylate kinase
MDQASLPDTIAIDGPAASGKSTLGRVLAERLGYRFLDTGLMYRAFTLAALRRGIPPSDIAACEKLAETLSLRIEAATDTRIFFGDEDVTPLLREQDVESNVSAYSAIPGVRSAMVGRQREFASSGRAVLAGRDIGTVVLPEAPLKFYLEASEEARASRRAAQSGEWGHVRPPSDARRDIAGRDTVDTSRPVGPLRPAADAVVIDTTDMTIQQVIDFALEKVQCAAG